MFILFCFIVLDGEIEEADSTKWYYNKYRRRGSRAWVPDTRRKVPFPRCFLHNVYLQISFLHGSSAWLIMCSAAGKKSSTIILLHGWLSGTIQLAKRISSMFSWQQAAHSRGRVTKRNMKSLGSWRWGSSICICMYEGFESTCTLTFFLK
jgi:hypothetical protein